MDYVSAFLATAWAMVAEMGAYLLVGFAVSALLRRWLKQAWVERLMGRRGPRSIVWGSLVGVPMPLCSCGVIPVTMSLRDKGASRGATVAFLTATPQTGVDSFLATAGMLGPVFAIFKLGVAFFSGLGVGLLVEAFSPKEAAPARAAASVSAMPQPTWRESLRYGFVAMPAELSGALLLGFVLAALVATLAPPGLFADLPGGALSSVLIVTLAAVPLYICSVGSIPLALALAQNGLPLSAVMVLLVAGPATSIATIAAARKILGGRATALYVAGVIVCSWIAAFAWEWFIADPQLTGMAMEHPADLEWWKRAAGVALLALLVGPTISGWLRRPKPGAHPAPVGDGERATVRVAGMTCSHCERSLQSGLASLPFVRDVLAIDGRAGTAVLQGSRLDEAAIRQTVESLGFEYKGLERA